MGKNNKSFVARNYEWLSISADDDDDDDDGEDLYVRSCARLPIDRQLKKNEEVNMRKEIMMNRNGTHVNNVSIIIM